MAADARPQAHRAALSGRRHVLLLRRRRVRGADPPRAGHAGRRPRVGRNLQQAVHDARRDDGVLLPHPGDSGRARQLPRADHDRREGSRVSEAQPRELVHLHPRRAVHAVRARQRRRRHGLDLLHAVQHRLVDDERHPDGARHLHHRLLVDPDGPQLHRHDSPDARARHDLVPDAAVHLVDLRDEPDQRARHAGHRDHDPAGRGRAPVPLRLLRSARRRRSGAVPASVLVLLAPGRVHHGAAGDGRRERTRRGWLPQAGLRLSVRRVRERGDRRARLPRLGPPHVRRGRIGVRGADLLDPQLPRGDSVGDQGLQLDGDDVQGRGLVGDADALRATASSACSRSAA